MPSVEEAQAARQQQLSSGSIPVVLSLSEKIGREALQALLAAGADGVAVPLAALRPLAGTLTQGQPASAAEAAAAVLRALAGECEAAAGSVPAAAAAPVAAGAAPAAQRGGAEPAAAAAPRSPAAAPLQLSQLLSTSREEMVAAEKEYLEEVRFFYMFHYITCSHH